MITFGKDLDHILDTENPEFSEKCPGGGLNCMNKMLSGLFLSYVPFRKGHSISQYLSLWCLISFLSRGGFSLAEPPPRSPLSSKLFTLQVVQFAVICIRRMHWRCLYATLLNSGEISSTSPHLMSLYFTETQPNQ